MGHRVVASVLCGLMAASSIGCSGGAPASGDQAGGEQTAATTAALTGREIFLGAYFGTGPAANLFPEQRQAASQALEGAKNMTGAQMAAKLRTEVETLRAQGGADTLADQFEASAARLEANANVKLARLAPPLSEEQRAARIDVVLSRVEADEPDYFATFNREMRSGNPIRVQAALKDGGERVYRVAQKASDALAAKQRVPVANGAPSIASPIGTVIPRPSPTVIPIPVPRPSPTIIPIPIPRPQEIDFGADILWVDNDVVAYVEVAIAAFVAIAAAVVVERPGPGGGVMNVADVTNALATH